MNWWSSNPWINYPTTYPLRGLAAWLPQVSQMSTLKSHLETLVQYPLSIEKGITGVDNALRMVSNVIEEDLQLTTLGGGTK